MKNIARNIHGYIVTDGEKYELRLIHLATSFVRKLESVIVDGSHGAGEFRYLSKWGWIQPQEKLLGSYLSDTKSRADERDKIVIYYEDEDGDPYRFSEDTEGNQNNESIAT